MEPNISVKFGDMTSLIWQGSKNGAILQKLA